MKKRIYFLFAVLLLLVHPAFCEDVLKLYKPGKEPRIKAKVFNKKLIPTFHLTKSPFGIRATAYEKAENVKKGVARTKVETGDLHVFLRIYIKNNQNKTYRNLYLLVEHFVIDRPYSSRGRKLAGLGEERMMLHETKAYRLKIVPRNRDMYIDTTGIMLRYFTEGRGRGQLYSGEVYGGFVLSIFEGDKLLLQMTSSKILRKKGMEELDDHIRTKLDNLTKARGEE